MKHHFIHLSCHPFVHSSGHPFISSWSVYSDGAKKEWNTAATQRRIIYISVVNFSNILNKISKKEKKRKKKPNPTLLVVEKERVLT